ncbi:MAG: S1 family peptidase [bacterium]|nr:S1 family peptidase [bacterium]
MRSICATRSRPVLLALRLLAAIVALLGGAKAVAQDGLKYEISRIPYPLESSLLSNTGPETARIFLHEIRLEDAEWTRLELGDLQLGPGDSIRISSRVDGEEQIVDDREPIYNGLLWSSVFRGGEIDIELHVSPASEGASFSIRALEIARLAYTPREPASSSSGLIPRTICNNDDRIPVAGPSCTVRIVSSDPNSNWFTGFMVNGHWMLTTAHTVNVSGLPLPWTVERNVPASDPNGTIVAAAADDQWQVELADLSSATGGLAFSLQQGHDWALIEIPADPNRPLGPGEGCSPVFYCGHDTTSAGGLLTIEGYGIDTEGTRNGVLQSDTGPAVASSSGLFAVRYQTDTEQSNSGSPIYDSLGRIIGIHGLSGCENGGTEGDNEGSLISNPVLLDAVKQKTGISLCADGDSDGLADDFETIFGSDPFLADSDADGDGDLVEYVAQSDPFDPNSDVSPVVRETPGAVELSWDAVAGLDYEVSFADGLAQANPGTQTAVLPTQSAFASVAGIAPTTTLLDDGNATGSSPAGITSRLYTLRVTTAVAGISVRAGTRAAITVQGTPAGFQRVDLPAAAYQILGMPFVPEDPSVHNVLGPQLDGGLDEFNADRIFAFDPATQLYETAFLFDGSGDPNFDQRFFPSAASRI